MSIHTYFFELIFRERILFSLAILIAILFLFTVVFGVYAVFLRIANERKRAHWEQLETAWEQEVLEVLAGEHRPDQLWRRVNKKDALYFVDFLLRYAQRLRGQERDILTELARPYLRQIARRMKEGDATQRARAAQTLSALGLFDYALELIAALDDPSPLVAMIAARALARKEHPQFAVPVLDRLHRFRSWSRNYLASMLAAVGSEITPALRNALADPNRSARTRSVSAEALLELNDFAAADTAARILETETDRDLLASCLRLLAQVGRIEHLSSVRRLCGSSDFVVRAHAVRALGSLGGAEDYDNVLQAFEDPSQWVAIHAAWALKDVGGLDDLKEIAGSDHPRADLARQVLTEEGS
ncbi:MAG: HEAT repeat domain-containing protein [bacterium]